MSNEIKGIEIEVDITSLDRRDFIEYFKLFCLAHEFEESDRLVEIFETVTGDLLELLKLGNDINYWVQDKDGHGIGRFSIHYYWHINSFYFRDDCDYKCPDRHKKRYENALRGYHRQLKFPFMSQ
ncbi:hypothetical protein HOD75_04785 [archaeon]|jgi:hypothetical protein|nr:hypothetical protein [archaeon]MBT4242180.1 hypothetical protein [archaeon]MBT4417868.1 hypothetical protein [archaeon]